jgi:hypothetical protein
VTEQGVYQQLRGHLYLRMSAAAEQFAAALENAQKSTPSYTSFLERLLAVEVEATERRRLEGRLRPERPSNGSRPPLAKPKTPLGAGKSQPAQSQPSCLGQR